MDTKIIKNMQNMWKKYMQKDLDRSRDGEIGVEQNRRWQMQLSRICWGTNQQKAKKISINPPGIEVLARLR